jgi:hypothetical protein
MSKLDLLGALVPLIRAFHGSTERGLKQLSTGKAIESRGATFHASNPDVAETFTFPREYGEMLTYDPYTGRELKRGRVYETELSPKNMYEMPTKDAQKFIDDSAYQQGVINELRRGGHDAVAVRDVLEGIGERHRGDVYGTFSNDIVKILRKYGVTGTFGAGGAASAYQPQGQR